MPQLETPLNPKEKSEKSKNLTHVLLPEKERIFLFSMVLRRQLSLSHEMGSISDCG